MLGKLENFVIEFLTATEQIEKMLLPWSGKTDYRYILWNRRD